MYIHCSKNWHFQSCFWISFVTFHPVPKNKIKPLQIKGRGGMIPNTLYVLFPLEVTGVEPLQDSGWCFESMFLNMCK